MKQLFKNVNKAKRDKEEEMKNFFYENGGVIASVSIEFEDIGENTHYKVCGRYGREEISFELLKKFAEKYNLDMASVSKTYMPNWNEDNLSEKVIEDMNLVHCSYNFTDQYQGWYD